MKPDKNNQAVQAGKKQKRQNPHCIQKKNAKKIGPCTDN